MPEQTPKRSPNAQPQPSAAGPRTTAKPAAKGQEAEYQFLPVQCPNCGLEGKVKISRLDRTFSCKQCKKVFHCALDGTVSGERPPDANPLALDAPVPESPPPWLVRVLGGLPRPVQWTALGGAALALLYFLVMLLEPAEPLPDELGSRAKLAAESFAHGDWKTLKRLAAKGKAGYLGTWYDRARPKEWADVTKESAVEIEVVSITKQLRGYTKKDDPIMDAISVANIRVPGKPPASQREELAFSWAVDDEQKYWLDGERMLAGYKPAKKKGDKAKSTAPSGD